MVDIGNILVELGDFFKDLESLEIGYRVKTLRIEHENQTLQSYKDVYEFVMQNMHTRVRDLEAIQSFHINENAMWESKNIELEPMLATLNKLVKDENTTHDLAKKETNDTMFALVSENDGLGVVQEQLCALEEERAKGREEKATLKIEKKDLQTEAVSLLT